MPAPLTGKLADPQFRRARASKAARASHSVDAHIRALVDAWPPLTPQQRETLRLILHPGEAPAAGTGGDSDAP
jgi:hypothetical protein